MPSRQLPQKRISQLTHAVGKSNVFTDAARLEPYTHDATPLLRGDPAAVVIVHSAKEVSAVMKWAYRSGVRVIPRGAGTGLSGGAVPLQGSVVMDMTPMNRILEIDRKNMSAWVEPGVITAVFQKKAASQGLCYPPDPGSAADCTLGGNVAENAGGIRGLKYGVTRDYVLGMEVILPKGDVLRLGGKSVRDVAGYNLKDLLIGSEGTLAIFTKLLLRLVPQPESSRTWLAAFKSVEAAGDAVVELMSQPFAPACVELIDRITWQAIQRYTSIASTTDPGALLLVEIDGTRDSVDADASAVEKLWTRNATLSVQRARNPIEAEHLKASRRCAFKALSALGRTAILEDAAVPRAAVPAMIRAIERSARRHRVLIGNFGHAGDGNLHPTCLIDGLQPVERDRAKAAFKEIYQAALDLGGTITGEHGVGLAKRDALLRQWPPAGLDLLQRVKNAFDPKNLLNPGKIFSTRPHCE
jgi:glycolate oxidase